MLRSKFFRHRHAFDHDCTAVTEAIDSTAANSSNAQPSKAAQYVEEIKKSMKRMSCNSAGTRMLCSAFLGRADQSSTSNEKPVNPKNAAMAAKIALMKLKQMAVGDAGKIPEEERIYLRLKLPAGCTWRNLPDMPVFFSKVNKIKIVTVLSLISYHFFALGIFCAIIHAKLFQTWSVGKCVDTAAKLASLSNQCSGPEKKVELYFIRKKLANFFSRD